MIDTHCHLTKRFFEKPKEVVARAKENGVEKIICIGTNLEDSFEAIEIANKFDEVFASVGIHPDSPSPSASDWSKFEKLINLPKVVAIGETGLDFKVGLPNQQEIFIKQIELAKKHDKPLIIHSRDAVDETFKILDGYQNLRGVFHFYSFGKSKINKVLDMGFYFGVDGNLTYEDGLQNVFKNIPIERVLLETDTPFLTPKPLRGSQNEPKNVKIIAQCLADIKGLTLEKIEKTTTQNANELFNFQLHQISSG